MKRATVTVQPLRREPCGAGRCEWLWAAALCSEMENFRHTDGGKGGVYLMPEATGIDEVTLGRQWTG